MCDGYKLTAHSVDIGFTLQATAGWESVVSCVGTKLLRIFPVCSEGRTVMHLCRICFSLKVFGIFYVVFPWARFAVV